MTRWQRLRGWLPRRDERGVVAIYVAILTPVMFGLAAFAVDVTRWYVELQRLQRAADAGALAAAPAMPADLSRATTVATDEVGRNGYPSTAVDVRPGNRSTQVRVTVSTTVSNNFARIFDMPTTTLSRSAVAEYLAPAPMGSACNTFGNDPEPPFVPALPGCDDSATPGFWATVQGPSTHKVQGDQFMTRACGAGGDCSGANDEFLPDGYFFVLRVSGAAVGRSINVEIFDPAWVNTGVDPDTRECERWPTGFDPPASTDCPFDYVPDPSQPEGRVDTTFALRAPIATLDPKSAPVVPGCVTQFRGITDPENLEEDADPAELAQVFRTWYPLCTIPNAEAGDYYLQVRTNRQLPDTGPGIVSGGPAATTPGDDLSAVGNGNNAFALRASVPFDSSASSGITVSAWERMPMFMNVDGSREFQLIRATPGAAGATITLNIFDIGDAEGGGSVSVLPPAEAAGDPRYSVGFGAGGNQVNDCNGGALSTCTVDFASREYNGRSLGITVPIPSGYDCDVDDPAGCLFRLRVEYASGEPVSDVTTWTAFLNTDPVRLVE